MELVILRMKFLFLKVTSMMVPLAHGAVWQLVKQLQYPDLLQEKIQSVKAQSLRWQLLTHLSISHAVSLQLCLDSEAVGWDFYNTQAFIDWAVLVRKQTALTQWERPEWRLHPLSSPFKPLILFFVLLWAYYLTALLLRWWKVWGPSGIGPVAQTLVQGLVVQHAPPPLACVGWGQDYDVSRLGHRRLWVGVTQGEIVCDGRSHVDGCSGEAIEKEPLLFSFLKKTGQQELFSQNWSICMSCTFENSVTFPGDGEKNVSHPDREILSDILRPYKHRCAIVRYYKGKLFWD